MQTWVVTGGAGYIGAHVVLALRASGRRVVVIDDLSSGSADRVPADVELVRASVLDAGLVTGVLRRAAAAGVVHLAARKSPTESVADPLLYARDNAGGVASLVEAVRAASTPALLFSSSCSVYGTPTSPVVDEDAPLTPESPYGDSKLYGERLVAAGGAAYGFATTSLRYFNVVGARGPVYADGGAYNLVPRVFAALRAGERPTVFGADYPTPDGTCVRDYVDVEDLADAHVRAVEALEAGPSGPSVYNVGRGTGSSVMEVLAAVEQVTGTSADPHVAPRRPGDPASVVGDVRRIAADLGWRSRRTLLDMVASAWASHPGPGGGADHRPSADVRPD